MDTWSDILLNWANNTGFTKQRHHKLITIDIDAFFIEFCKNIHGVRITQTSLISFLNVHYPAFKLIGNNEHDDAPAAAVISVDDFVYVYSLLLHFSCVKYPETDIQKCCSSLENRFQQCIAVFFTALIKESQITRKALEDAIKNSSEMDQLMSPVSSLPTTRNSGGCVVRKSVIMMSPCVKNRINNSDSSDGNNSSGGESNPPDSPRAGGSLFSPLTPRTKLLDNWKLENKNLKAEIETERYERSFLESHNQELEGKVNDLILERARYIGDIKELKNKLLIKDTENVSPNGNVHEEQIKRRLRKDIADKDEQIIALELKLETCNENNVQLRNKLKLNENKINKLNGFVNELNDSVEELQQKLIENEHSLKIQIDSNVELHEYINELKANSGNLLDSSIECLNSSSSSSNSSNNNKINKSPENLSKTVVDVQFREQQLLNHELKVILEKAQVEKVEFLEKIQQNMIDLKSLEQQLKDSQTDCENNKQKFVNSNAKSELLVKDLASMTEKVKDFEVLCEQFDNLKLENNENLLKLQQQSNDTNIIKLHNENLLKDNENLTTTNKKQLEIIENHKVQLKQNKETIDELSNNLHTTELKILNLRAHVNELNEQILQNKLNHTNYLDRLEKSNQLNQQYQQKINEFKINNSIYTQDINKQILKLKNEISVILAEKSDVEISLEEQTNENSTVTASLHELQHKHEETCKKLTIFELESTELKHQLDEQIKQNENVQLDLQKEQLLASNLTNEISSLQANINRLNIDLLSLKNNLLDEENEKEQLKQKHQTNEDNLQLKLEEITKRYDDLMTEFNNYKNLNDLTIKTLKTNQDKTNNELIEKDKQLKTENQHYLKQIMELKTQISRLDLDLKNEQDYNFQIVSECQTLRTEVHELNQKCTDHVEDHSKKINATKQECEIKINEQLIKFEETHSTLQNKYDVLEQEMISTTEKLSQKERESNQQQEKQQTELQKCAETIKLLNKQIDLLESNKKEFVLKNETLLENIKQTDETINLLNTQSLKNDQQLFELNEKIKEITEKNEKNVEDSSKKINATKQECEIKINEQLIKFEETQSTLQNKYNVLEQEMISTIENISQKERESNMQQEKQQTELQNSTETIKLLNKQIDLLESNKKELVLKNETLLESIKQTDETISLLNTKSLKNDQQLFELNEKNKEIMEKNEKYVEESSKKINATKQECEIKINEQLGKFEETQSTLQNKNNVLELEMISTKEKLSQKERESKLQLEKQQTELEQSTETIKLLNKQIDLLESNKKEFVLKNETLLESIKQTDETISLLNTKSLKNDQQLFELNEKIKEITEKNKKYVEDHSKKINATKQECEIKINEQLVKFEETQSTLQKKYDVLEQEMISTTEKLSQKERESNMQQEKQQTELQNSAETIKLLNKQIDLLESNKKELVLKYETLLENIKQTDETISLLNTKSLKNDQQLFELNEKNKEIMEKNEKYVEESSKKINATKQECEIKINEQLGKFEETQSTLQNKNNVLELEMISTKEKLSQKERESKLQLEKQQTELKQSTETIKLLNKQIGLLESNKKEFVLKNETLLESIKQTDETISLLNTKSLKNDQQLFELNEKIKEVTETNEKNVEESSEKINATKQECEIKMNEQLVKFEETKSTLQNKYNVLEQEMISTIEKLSQKDRESNLQQTDLQNSTETIKLLNKQIDLLESNQKELILKNGTLLENIKQTGETINLLNAKSLKNDQQLFELNEKNKEIIEKNEKYQKENQNIKHEIENLTKSIEENKLTIEKMKISSETERSQLNTKIENQFIEIQRLQQLLAKEKLICSQKDEQIEEINRITVRSDETHKSHIECLEREKEQISQDLVEKENSQTKLQCEFDELAVNYQQIALNHQNLQTNNNLQTETIKEMEKQHEKLCEKIKSEKNDELKLNEKKYLNNLMEKEENIITLQTLVEKQNDEIDKLKYTCSKDWENFEKIQLDNMKSVSQLNNELETIFSGCSNSNDLTPSTIDTNEAKVGGGNNNVTGIVTQILNRLIEFKGNYSKRDNEYQSCRAELENEKKETDKRCVQLEMELNLSKKAFDDLQKEMNHSIAVFRAKLTKEREDIVKEKEKMAIEKEDLAIITEKRVTDTRLELEGKLEKMKTRMKQLYNEESTKLKTKYENELIDLKKIYNKQEREIFVYKSEEHKLKESLKKHEFMSKSLSDKIYTLNEEKLEVIKEREFLLNKILLLESGTKRMGCIGGTGGGSSKNIQQSRSKLLPASSMASLIKMEDEEGELFNNTYLNELKSGVHRMENGRESVRASELMFRNSMLRPHLRSTYAAQYIDETYDEDDLKAPSLLPYQPSINSNNLHDESFVGSQSSDVRRGTLYQKPGPPTPSKNGGRLSFGGGGVAGSGNARLSFGSGGSAELRSGSSGRLSFGGVAENREVLKEKNVRNVKNTPSTGGVKWSTWFSSSTASSLSSTIAARGKDENSTPKRRHGLFKKARDK